jgi:hypothetical protein
MLKFRLMSRSLVLTVFALLLNTASAETAGEVANKAYWICKSKKQVRTIRVHINHTGICATFYSRDGSEKIVGSGKNHESCMTFLNSIKTNLEKSNWSCRDITDTKMTASLE